MVEPAAQAATGAVHVVDELGQAKAGLPADDSGGEVAGAAADELVDEGSGEVGYELGDAFASGEPGSSSWDRLADGLAAVAEFAEQAAAAAGLVEPVAISGVPAEAAGLAGLVGLAGLAERTAGPVVAPVAAPVAALAAVLVAVLVGESAGSSAAVYKPAGSGTVTYVAAVLLSGARLPRLLPCVLGWEHVWHYRSGRYGRRGREMESSRRGEGDMSPVVAVVECNAEAVRTETDVVAVEGSAMASAVLQSAKLETRVLSVH